MQSDKIRALHRTLLFGSLDQPELEQLAQRAVFRSVRKNEILFQAGDIAQGMYVIVEGSLRAVRTNLDGREQVIHVERAGSTVAEIPVFDGGVYPSTVVAEEDSVLLFLNKHDVRALCLEYPQIAVSALAVLSRKIRQCAELIEFLSLREVGQRIARLLVLEAQNRGTTTGKGTTMQLHLTNQQIAAQVGSVREVVSRAMTRLHKEQFILLEGKTLTIPNLEKLKEYADF
ncbi:MAG: Crp/Fnr family transcriptional regulator [Blastocatellia bacterium]|nr:Crp/Fnr family transcriptional regulator [Blastocatellia bacterium]